MRGARDDSTTKLAAAASAFALAVGVFMGLVILASQGSVILAFVMLSVVPTVLGYAGLSRTGHLPWEGTDGTDEELVEELKHRYATGELGDAEMERKVETLLGAEEDGSRTSSPRREPRVGRTRR